MGRVNIVWRSVARSIKLSLYTWDTCLKCGLDEPLDDETAGIVGTEGTVEALVKFADKMNEALPEELHKGKARAKVIVSGTKY